MNILGTLLLEMADDAIAYRTPDGWCADCAASDDDGPATGVGLCAIHEADFRRAEQYREARLLIAAELTPVAAKAGAA